MHTPVHSCCRAPPLSLGWAARRSNGSGPAEHPEAPGCSGKGRRPRWQAAELAAPPEGLGWRLGEDTGAEGSKDHHIQPHVMPRGGEEQQDSTSPFN